jgi:hypothetical protein
LFFITLYGECRGESIEGQVACAMVIQNRLKSGMWFGGDNYHDVLGRWAQFSALWPTLAGGIAFQETIDMAGVYHRGEEVGTYKRQLVKQLLYVTDGVMGGHVLDPTYHATHYYAPHIVGRPNWAASPAHRTVRIGRHDFWAGVA